MNSLKRAVGWLKSPHLPPLCLFFFIFYLLIKPSLPLYFWIGHEQCHAVMRVKWMAEQWALTGPFHYPWFPEVCFGYGWPFFTFYAPLGYYVAGAAHFLLGMDYGRSTKFSFYLSMLVGGLALYAFALLLGRRARWPRIEWWGAAAATLYTLAPYHLTDVFARSSLAESWGFALVPVFFLCIEIGRRRPRLGFLLVAMSTNLLILSHNITALYCVLFGALYVVLTSPRLLWTWTMAVAMLFGFGLSAYFWIPANSLIKSVMAGDPYAMSATPEAVSAQAVLWRQHLTDVYDKGGSNPGDNDQMGIQMGRLILFWTVAASVVMFWRGVGSRHRYRLFIYLALTGIALFICSPQMPWANAPRLLIYVQYPWRVLLFADFFACAAILLASPIMNRWIHPAVIMALAALFYIPAVGPKLDFSYWTEKPTHSDTELNDFFAFSEQNRGFAGCIAQEYRPIWVSPTYLDPVFQKVNPPPANRLSVIGGSINVLSHHHEGASYTWTCDSSTSAVARIHVFDFPGWELKIDGAPAQEGRLGREAAQGLVTIDMPAGVHDFTLAYGLSPIGKKARTVSYLSWLLWLALIPWVYGWRKLQRSPAMRADLLNRLGLAARRLGALQALPDLREPNNAAPPHDKSDADALDAELVPIHDSEGNPREEDAPLG